MKYLISIGPDGVSENVIVTSDDINFVSFPAVVGNPNYDQFLVQAELTDKQVHALTPDVWYDFPTQKEAK